MLIALYGVDRSGKPRHIDRGFFVYIYHQLHYRPVEHPLPSLRAWMNNPSGLTAPVTATTITGNSSVPVTPVPPPPGSLQL